MTAPAGIDTAAVDAWLREHAPAIAPPVRWTAIEGGRSNLTYTGVDRHGTAWVLRRPPLGAVLESAHDVVREQRVIHALGPTPVPVPEVVAVCQDRAVNDAPFYVMSFVAGRVVRTPAEALAMGHVARGHTGRALVDVLAAIHAVDPDQIGLGDLGRPDGFAARQIRRWRTQVERASTRKLPQLFEVADELERRVPPQTETTIIHGDFRIDNCILGEGGTVEAVLDWELSTRGDPRSDVGLLLAYWADPADGFTALQDPPTAVAGFASRAELLDGYADASGRDLSSIDFWIALAYWKLACIVEGVYTRLIAGVMGDASVDPAPFGERVPMLVTRAARQLEGVS